MKRTLFLITMLTAVFAVASLIGGCGQTTDDLIRDLSAENSRTRLRAATTLIGRDDKDTTPLLIKELEKNDDRLTFIVTQILGDRADTSAVGTLGKVSKHSNPHIRARAFWSIGSIGHPSGLPHLVEGLQDSVAMVRHAAVQGIGNMHYGPAARHLYPMLRDEADSIRTAAIQSIYNSRRIAGSGVLAADLAVSVNDPSQVVRYVAVQALGGGFPDTTVAGELLVEALRDENKDVRVEAIMSIKKIRYGEAIPVLKRIYDTATVDEEFAISEAIKEMTGESFPSESGN
ncbi:MAG: HEAT repeat domain-containing protein [Candidatus Latescibacterota bacterium]